MSAFEDALDGDARRRRLDEIEALIREHDVRHVYLQYTSIPGRVMGKVVPAGHFSRFADSGIAWANVSAGGFTVSRTGDLIGPDAVSCAEGVLLPDLSTFQVLPWDTDMSRVICDHFNARDAAERAGEPAASDGRGNLKRLHAAFKEDFGLEVRTGCEPEMSWFPSREEITASIKRLPDHVGSPYHIEHIEDIRHILKRVTQYGQALGLDMIQADYEDPGQIEMNFMFGPSVETADRLTTYRQICMQVAREFNVFATFMPKPVAGIMGNGCHHHVSLWRGEVPAFVNPNGPGISDIGRWAIGGLLTHARGMSAVLAPSVNSYARYWDVGQFAPTVPVWGIDNRQCIVRVLGGNRAEYRPPDGHCNPYLSHAVLLAAIRDGIENEIEPGDPHMDDNSPDPADARFGLLPRTLGEAVDALAQDEVVRSALPGDLYDTFHALKLDEWERSCGAITDWQLDTYLNYLP